MWGGDGLMSRPDLSWLREAVGLGTVFNAIVAQPIPTAGSSSSRSTGDTARGGPHVAPGTPCACASPRASHPRDEPPDGLSLHNVLSGTVSAVHADPAFNHVVVQLAVGRVLLLAEVTRDAVQRLGVSVGMDLYALIKSVSVELVAPGSQAGSYVGRVLFSRPGTVAGLQSKTRPTYRNQQDLVQPI